VNPEVEGPEENEGLAIVDMTVELGAAPKKPEGMILQDTLIQDGVKIQVWAPDWCTFKFTKKEDASQ
jgi:hypothetical protein